MKANKVAQVLTILTAAILVLLPFHALFTTWLGSNFGNLDYFRVWKELIILIASGFALGLLLQNKQLFGWLRKTGLLYLIGGYILLFIITGLVAISRDQVNISALLYSWLANLRFLIFFVICIVAASYSDWLKSHWKQLLLIPAAVVIGFGLLQLVLPRNFLAHFGYGTDTIPAYTTVDQKTDYVRIQSTLRGPNPLGAYMVVIIMALGALVFKDKTRRNWWLAGIFASGIVLFFTYSRSGWLGVCVAVIALVWLLQKQMLSKRKILAVASVTLLLVISLLVGLRQNDRFQNLVFHTDENSLSAESSNQSRASSLKKGLTDIVREPWGRGPGTAGPPSFRNDHPPRISENYFLQIGQEAGIVGLAIFAGINILVGFMLWRQKSTLSIVLLASLIAITIVNLVSHAWSDDTLGLLWWGFAGIALAPSAILNKERKLPNAKT